MGNSSLNPLKRQTLPVAVLAMGLAAAYLAGCGRHTSLTDEAQREMIRVEGSDTMVNIAQAWAETYHQQRPDVIVQVLGGGSGVGIASLIDGNCDMANSSRLMKQEEIDKTQSSRGEQAVQHVVGFDAMGIYVHPSNPIPGISMEELAAIFGENPSVTQWSELGVTMPRECRTRSSA